MVSQTELISKGYHSLVPSLISIFLDFPFKMLILNSFMYGLLACINTIYKYCPAWVIQRDVYKDSILGSDAQYFRFETCYQVIIYNLTCLFLFNHKH